MTNIKFEVIQKMFFLKLSNMDMIVKKLLCENYIPPIKFYLQSSKFKLLI